MAIYSHSRLSTFEQCPAKFKYRYVDKISPDHEQSIEGFLGNKVHDTLEWIYNNQERDLELDDIIMHYIGAWNNDHHSGIKIIKEELNAEHYFNKGIKFLINYFLKHSPFRDNTIATEKKVYVNLSDNHKLIGFIDRLVHNKEKNTFEIHDYKTGSIKSQKELNKDRQLALYSIAIRESFENVEEVDLIWHFLDHDEIMKSKRTLDDLKQLKDEIIALINKIESTQDFEHNPSTLCKWCEFRSHCPIIKENPSYPD